MILLQVKNLTKTYVANIIFNSISFVLHSGQKVGLVGANGAGKTTLMRCLTGEENPDEGEITIAEKTQIGYLEQITQYAVGTTLFDAVMESFSDILELRRKMRSLEKAMGECGNELEQIMKKYGAITEEYERAGGFSCESTTRKIIVGLGFTEDDLNKDVSTFSGGEKTRVSLARLLVRQPDLLLLDEPTNHLDLDSVEWLESYLKAYSGAVLVISHDRYFLDQVTERTLELEHGSLYSFNGNYSTYLFQKEELVNAQTKAFVKQQKEIERTEAYIDRYRAGIKAKQARGRQLQLDRVERLHSPGSQSVISINHKSRDIETSGQMVMKAEELSYAYNQSALFQRISFTILKGEKVALIGGNGTGKTTLLKLVIGELCALEGMIQLGSKVKIGYYDQQHSGLNPKNSVLDEIIYNFDVTIEEARNRLAQFLFYGEDVYKKVEALSGGEKGRLSFLKILLRDPNFLVLDEPTNHLDISSKDVIEQYLQAFEGTMLVVSHDRYFLDKIVRRTLELRDKSLITYLGNYSYYKEKRDFNQGQETADKKKSFSSNKADKDPDKPKINKAKTRERIEQLEREIEERENRRKELAQVLAESATYQDEDSAKLSVQEYHDLEEQIETKYQEWEALNELLA